MCATSFSRVSPARKPGSSVGRNIPTMAAMTIITRMLTVAPARPMAVERSRSAEGVLHLRGGVIVAIESTPPNGDVALMARGRCVTPVASTMPNWSGNGKWSSVLFGRKQWKTASSPTWQYVRKFHNPGRSGGRSRATMLWLHSISPPTKEQATAEQASSQACCGGS